MDSKKNGGILFTKFLVIFKGLFVLWLLTNSGYAFSQLRIIADNKEDSCFCVTKYPYYDFENQSYVTGHFAPDQMIEGEQESLVNICIRAQRLALAQYRDSAENVLISLDVLVDKNGKVRGAVIPDDGEMTYEISRYVFLLLKKEKYKPAYSRGKPITSTFHFPLRFP
jgi:hypothetical protein